MLLSKSMVGWKRGFVHVSGDSEGVGVDPSMIKQRRNFGARGNNSKTCTTFGVYSFGIGELLKSTSNQTAAVQDSERLPLRGIVIDTGRSAV